jgi:hypothetical protein
MNFGLAFSYVFKEKDQWFKKIALPALCSLIPVIGPFILMGWGLKATQNVIEGNEEYALPKLEFGADLGRGFMAFLISLIYSLPTAIISGIAGALFGVGSGMDEETVMIILYIVGGCLGLLALFVGLFVAFMGMAGLANYAAKGKFGAAFDFKTIFGMLKKSFVSWLLVAVGYILAMGIIAPLGTVVCVIGVLLTSAYATAIFFHLLGQAYNQSVKPATGEVEPL